VEGPVGGVGGARGAVQALELLHGGPDHGDLGLGGLAGCGRRGLPLDEAAGPDQLEGALALVAEAGERRGPGLGDEHAGADADLHLARHLEGDEGLADGRTGHAELLGEVALGGEALPRGELALGDQVGELTRDLPVEAVAVDGLDRHGWRLLAGGHHELSTRTVG
jgi:hypothetical protein